VSALLEREGELAELDTMVGEVCAGRGCFAVIEAAAGLGKTRLLQAARTAGQDAGMRVLAGRATELERDFPFALVRQLFEPPLLTLNPATREALLEGAAGAARGALGLNGDEPTTASGGGAPDTFGVLHGLYWLTAALAEQQPLLLALDDAHWSDAASLDYVGFLLPRLEELPVLLAVSCRPDEAGAEGSLARIATDGLARRLAPRVLSRTATATLLAAELDEEPEGAFAATCHEVSGGNPFLLHELARTVAVQAISPSAEQAPRVHELAPERVARTVLVRLAHLSGNAQAVARALVVLGDDADYGLVADLAGLDADTTLTGADELRVASILDPDTSLRFVHPLVRTALHHELPAGERADAHARAAELLRARGASAQRLAAHLVATEARGDRDTVTALIEAGKRALASGAPRSAIAYLTRALREPPSADLRAAVLDPLITACIRTSDQSVYTAIEAEVLAELERNPSSRSRWGTKLTTWMAINGRTKQAISLLKQAIEVASDEDDVDRAFQLEAQLSTLTRLPPAEARARLARYGGRFEANSASGRLAAALEAQWHVLDGTAIDAVEAAGRALQGNCRIFSEQLELLAPGGAVLVLIAADELELAEHGAERALAIGQERSGTPETVGAWWLNGAVALARGDLAVAEADLRQALSLARLGKLQLALPLLIATLTHVLIERGELEEAEGELKASGMADAIPDHIWFAQWLFVRGQLRLEQGRFAQAVEDFAELERRATAWGMVGMPTLQARTYSPRALAALRLHERAREQAQTALVHARRWGAPTAVARALRALGAALEGPECIAPFEEALAVLDGSPARLARARALCDLGTALRHANRRAEAREPLREGLELARRCGATGLAKQGFNELQATGERVRRYTPIGLESLTPSERRVAEMAASGMTNRQIAQSLFLTVKTIETHLAATYDKLGIRSRRLLPEAFGARPGAAPSASPSAVAR
jgi:DNA-binding CsgD family transcriptional regulator